jgi:hypothetical protein
MKVMAGASDRVTISVLVPSGVAVSVMVVVGVGVTGVPSQATAKRRDMIRQIILFMGSPL